MDLFLVLTIVYSASHFTQSPKLIKPAGFEVHIFDYVIFFVIRTTLNVIFLVSLPQLKIALEKIRGCRSTLTLASSSLST